MKKLLATILCALIITSCAACSSGDKKSLDKKDPEVTAEEVVTEDPEDDVAVDGILARGVIDGKEYFSTFTGIKLKLKSDWNFSSDEEIARVLSIGAEVLDINEFAKTVGQRATTYDMMAKSTAGSNVAIAYENLDITAPGRDVDVSDYRDSIVNMLTNQTQVNYTLGTQGVVKICGEKYTRVELIADFNGVTMSQYYYLRKIDNIMVSMIITTVNGAKVQDIEKMFVD